VYSVRQSRNWSRQSLIPIQALEGPLSSLRSETSGDSGLSLTRGPARLENLPPPRGSSLTRELTWRPELTRELVDPLPHNWRELGTAF
jgi:hypothetical protein